jgi:hypothetical protein
MVLLLNMLYATLAFAGLLLLGQGAVYLMCLGRHEENAVYRMMRFLTSPVTRVVRKVTPAGVSDKHVPFVAFFLIFWLCLALAYYLGSVALASRGL